MSEQEEEQLQRAITRRQLFGEAGRVESTTRKYNLDSTLGEPGLPCKFTSTIN